MSDLTDYDRAIVAATEYLVDRRQDSFDTAPNVQVALNAVEKAVKAKRDAQRPKCDSGLGPCMKPAVQEIVSFGTDKMYRCVEHRIEAREL